jgi:transcriptional regulator with XRE-family HTH domain
MQDHHHVRGLRAVLAQNVRAFRRELGWSQEELADHAKMDRTYVSQIERAICNPSLESIAKIAAALQVPAWQLLGPRRAPPPQTG